MKQMTTLIEKLKPGIPRRHLLMGAAIFWTMAGIMLFVRGAVYVMKFSNFKGVHFLLALLFGIAFFWALFTRISSNTPFVE